MIDLLRDLMERGINVEINAHIKLSLDGIGIKYPARCPRCGWSKLYTSQASASRALRAHEQHCSANASKNGANAVDVSWVPSNFDDTTRTDEQDA